MIILAAPLTFVWRNIARLVCISKFCSSRTLEQPMEGFGWFDLLEDEQKLSMGGMLALLKYPFYYMIRSRFGKFFGMIHVLTRHLAPELDHFRFCPGFWSILHFDRNWDIFGDVLTHGYNWAKMRNKSKNQHAKDGNGRGQKRPRPAGLESLGRPA